MMDEQEEQVYREMAEEAAFEHLTGGPIMPARRMPDESLSGLTPAERAGYGSDRKAAALTEIDTIKHFGIDGVTGYAALERLEAIIRSMP